MLCVDANEYKGKRRKKPTLLMWMVDVQTCGHVACGRVGMQTWMVVDAGGGCA